MASDNTRPPIGVALIGSGLFPQREILPAILATPNISLKAVFSRSLKSATELIANLTEKVDVYATETENEGKGYHDLLQDSNIKAVVIALPILAQPPYIRKALSGGKHVLSEKPIAADSTAAQNLIDYYSAEIDKKVCTWSVAENLRFFDSHVFAAQKVREMGRILGFRIHSSFMVDDSFIYHKTEWRRDPGYQGGYILDGGIHVVAATRLLLGESEEPTRVSAYTVQLQPHLPPIDTVNATIKTKSGISGTLAVSSGIPFGGTGYTIACEKGTVTVGKARVVIERDGQKPAQDFPDEGWGVAQEISQWSNDIMSGIQDPRLAPNEALKDLHVLEAILRSGENDGAPVDVVQSWAA